MTPLLVVIALVGWIDDVPLADAIAEGARESTDRVARAEAVQHWLLAALDEATDAIVVVDRIGREIVRNAPARRFKLSPIPSPAISCPR